MRPSSQTRPQYLDQDANNPPTPDQCFALILGHDFCAEHECGIQPLADRFGVPHYRATEAQRLALGLGEHRVPAPVASLEPYIVFDPGEPGPAGRTTVFGLSHDAWNVQSDSDLEALLQMRHVSIPPLAPPDAHRRRRPTQTARLTRPPRPTCSTWSDRGFLIATRDDVIRPIVHDLHRALRAGDLLLSIGPSANPFEWVAGLVLGIWPRVPAEFRAEYQRQLEDHIALEHAAAATGIHARLEAAGRRYIALTPQWVRDGTSRRGAPDAEDGTDSGATDASVTNHPVRFWLNPMDQHLFNAGWFTVEELEAWADGYGPVVKTLQGATTNRNRRTS